uniref:Metalloendopeptidase n=1 Tax=Daphnia galeata TaxID=27404 RepID=A0A8J2RI99_9CRUS|nr:unnamed protein product [Daphnia galeata]
MSQRPLLITIMVIYVACGWLGVTSSPIILTSDGLDDIRSSVPNHTLPSGPTEESEIGLPLTEEELSSNISFYRISGASGSGSDNKIPEELVIQLSGGDIMSLSGDKNAVIDPNSLWPNAQIPYVISASYTSDQRRVIGYAMNEYHSKTCIRFIPRTNQHNYIYIRRDLNVGCWSYVGMNGNGAQYVSLPDYCVSSSYPGSVIHELMHATRFQHEHQRPDQQYYINVNYPNIRPDNHQFFNPFKSNEVNTLGLPYDTKSVMHYPSSFMANNPSIPTMIARSGELNLGNLKGFTQLDIQKINKLYKCRY